MAVDVITKAAIACIEVMAPELDDQNKARAIGWLGKVMSERKLVFVAARNRHWDAEELRAAGAGDGAAPEVESSHE